MSCACSPPPTRYFRFNPTDVWTLFHSLSFDFSVWEIWGALFYGGRLVIVPPAVSRSPREFYDLVMREQVTVLNQIPSAFMQLIKVSRAAAPQEHHLRYVIFGGEALAIPQLKPWFEQFGDTKPRLINMYGITETTVHVTYYRGDAGRYRQGREQYRQAAAGPDPLYSRPPRQSHASLAFPARCMWAAQG